MSSSTLERQSPSLEAVEDVLRSERETLVGSHAVEQSQIPTSSLDVSAFSLLKSLNHEYSNKNSEFNITKKHLTLAAIGLANRITEHEEIARKVDVGIDATLTVLHAWDHARSPETAELTESMLGYFKGGAKENLIKAYSVAKRSDRPFDIVLNELNEQYRNNAA